MFYPLKANPHSNNAIFENWYCYYFVLDIPSFQNISKTETSRKAYLFLYDFNTNVVSSITLVHHSTKSPTKCPFHPFSEYLATFKKTVAMHEVFLQRLAAHPQLRTDHNFKVFLEYKQDVSVVSMVNIVLFHDNVV